MNADAAPVQLALDVRLGDQATFENFYTDDANQQALQAARELLATSSGQSVLLHGPPGSGRSHILQAACHAGGAESRYLPMRELAEFAAADVLDGFLCSGLLAVDDVQCVAGKPHWEQALFGLFNQQREAGYSSLWSANAAPSYLGLQLPDLESRLAWGGVFALPTLDDNRRLAVLRYRAARRGLQLSPELAGYILRRAPRDLDGLLQVLERVDREALSRRSGLTQALVKSVMAW